MHYRAGGSVESGFRVCGVRVLGFRVCGSVECPGPALPPASFPNTLLFSCVAMLVVLESLIPSPHTPPFWTYCKCYLAAMLVMEGVKSLHKGFGLI